MRKMKFFSGAIMLGLFIFSCNPCANLDCLSNDFDGQFRIVSAADGKDLVFGPSKIYDKNQIKFYSLQSTDTTFFNYETISFPNVGYDSILLVNFNPKTDIAYMRLGNGDIDTLSITYNSFNTKCCGTITEIRNFRFNNAVDLSGKGIQEIKK
jgi:hypothetical protein